MNLSFIISGKNARLFVMTVLFILLVPSANAQALPISVEGLDHINRIRTAAPGVGTVGTVAGAVATAANDALIKPGNVRIPVTVAANVGRARIVTGALGCTNLIGAVACVATAAAVLNEVANSPTGFGRYRPCPDGTSGFVCKPAPETDPDVSGYLWAYTNDNGAAPFFWANSATEMCNKVAVYVGRAPNWTARPLGTSKTQYYCWDADGNNTGHWTLRASNQCRAGFAWQGSSCVYTGAPQPDVAVPQQEIEKSLQERMDADFQANKRLYDALMEDLRNNPNTFPSTRNPVNDQTPVTVTAPTVTTQPRTVSTETITNPDGTTSTRTKTEQTTFSPTTEGSTVGDTQIRFPSQTTVTTTTVNNTTNQTTTETTIINNPSPEPAAETGPKECGTPGRPRCQIDEAGTPDGKTAYQTSSQALDTVFQDATTKLGNVTAPDGKDTSWGWVPLSWVQPGACHALDLGTLPVIETVIHFDVCPQLAMASELLSFLWATGTIWLCISMVWATMQGQGV